MDREENIYKPPGSELFQVEAVPDTFLSGAFTTKKLYFLGWFSLATLLVDIPGFILSFMYGFSGGGDDFAIYMHLFTVFSTLAWVYLLVQFRLFLTERFGAVNISWNINVLVGLSILLGLFSIVFVDGMEDPFGAESVIFYLLLIPYGVVSVLLGKKLLGIEYGYRSLRLFAWLFILGGVFTASIFLVIFAYLFGFIYTIVLALIFFSGAKEMKIGCKAMNA
jgi:hypothetical protein